LRLAQAKSSQDLSSKISRAKYTGGSAEVVEHLLCKFEALGSNSNLYPTSNKVANESKFPVMEE
jgi:hypothetical protein